MDAREANGKKVLGKLLGEEFANGLEAHVTSGGFGSEAGRLALGFAFNDVWGRPGLAWREKSLVTIGALVALGTFEELKNHLRAGMNNGLSAQDLEAALTQLIPYVGFPTIAVALRAAGEVLQERAAGK
jgi:4-carboxymuconolactone decarboxylase